MKSKLITLALLLIVATCGCRSLKTYMNVSYGKGSRLASPEDMAATVATHLREDGYAVNVATNSSTYYVYFIGNCLTGTVDVSSSGMGYNSVPRRFRFGVEAERQHLNALMHQLRKDERDSRVDSKVPSNRITLRFDGLQVQPDKSNIVITNVVDEFSISVVLASGSKAKDIFVSSDSSFMFKSAADIKCFDSDGKRIGYSNLEASWAVPTPRSYTLLNRHLGNEGDECWCCVESVIYRRKLMFLHDYSVTDPPDGCLVLPLKTHRMEMNVPVELSYNVKGTTNLVADIFVINAEILLRRHGNASSTNKTELADDAQMGGGKR